MVYFICENEHIFQIFKHHPDVQKVFMIIFCLYNVMVMLFSINNVVSSTHNTSLEPVKFQINFKICRD